MNRGTLVKRGEGKDILNGVNREEGMPARIGSKERGGGRHLE